MPKSNEHIINLINGTAADFRRPHRGAKSTAAYRGRTVAFVDAQNQHHGFIKDISTKGASVFLDRNLQSLEFIKLHIHVPPSHTLKTPRLIEVYGKIVYTTHDINDVSFPDRHQFSQIRFTTRFGVS